MSAPVDLEKLASSLTKAQRDALCCARRGSLDVLVYDRGVTRAALRRKGLAKGGQAYPSAALTPLGLALRHHLITKEQGNG